MSTILTPGYLRWDGTKYVLDHDIEIVGPPGSAGPTGPIGPAGPPGPFGTATGDISGTYPGPISVIGLTGISGVVSYATNITNPTITQTSTGGTTGQTLTFKAQNAALIGGNTVIQSGTGTTSGLIQFLVGNSTAAFFDANSAFRVGPNAASTVTGPNGLSPIAGSEFIFGNNAAGNMFAEIFSGGSGQRALMSVLNYSTAGTGVNGVTIQAPGSVFSVGSYQNNGVIEQSGVSTSGLIFSKILGDGTNRGVVGRIWQTGAWSIGDVSNSNTTTQAGINGPILNFATATGSLSTSSGQGVIYKTNAGGSDFGTLNLQGNTGVNLVSATTVVATTTTTKLVTFQGRRIKVVNTTTSPYNVLASDEVISVGNITTNSTTIAVGSNGASLPQTTVNVASTTGFPTSGFILVTTTNGPQTVSYTGLSGGNQFTGCSGGTGTMSTGGVITSLFTVNLPTSPTTGDTYTVKDAFGNAALNNILVFGNGPNIDGFSTIVISTNYTQASLIYNGTSWVSSLSNNFSPTIGASSVVNVVSGGSTNVVGLDQLLLCDPTSSSCTVTAPANPVIGMRFTVKDATAKSNINPIVVQGNGRTLENPIAPGTYASPINITSASLSATWAFDPTRNRYTLV